MLAKRSRNCVKPLPAMDRLTCSPGLSRQEHCQREMKV
ncbi:hypothetical protein J2Z50_005322 [Ensifer mexicanus]|nr:hypothetical protein [Sinorhizobium mexicanum]